METAIQTPSPTRERRSGRLIGGSLLGIFALLLIAAAAGGLWARFGASDHGYITSGSHRYAAAGRAIVSGSVDADGIPDWLVAKVRVEATSNGSSPLFVGVGRRADVDRYLAGVARSTVEDVNFGPFHASYSSAAGAAVPARPAAQRFWVESKTGAGTQSVTWKLRNGSWRLVVMNADGSPHVSADAKVGASIRGALPIALSVLGVGLALAVAAGALILGVFRRR